MFYSIHGEMLKRVQDIVRSRGLNFLVDEDLGNENFKTSFEQHAKHYVVDINLDMLLQQRPARSVRTALQCFDPPTDVLEAAYGFVSPITEKRELYERLMNVAKSLRQEGGGGSGGGGGRA